jgi:TolB-like protein
MEPRQELSPNPKILLLPVLGREPEANQKMTGALLGVLSQRGFLVVMSTTGQESAVAALDHAARDGFDYVLAGNLPQWGDEVELAVNLFEVSSRASVASASHHAKKRPGHWPSDPEDFIPELADCSLARIFGWTPRAYAGDPPH